MKNQIIFLITIFSLTACSGSSENTNSQATMNNPTYLPASVSEETTTQNVKDDNSIIDYAWGYSFKVLPNFRFVTNNNNQKYGYALTDAPAGNDQNLTKMMSILPFSTATYANFQADMENSGARVGKDENGFLTATIAGNGLSMTFTYVESPFGGGIMLLNVTKDGYYGISSSQINAFTRSLRFYQPTLALQQRQAFEYQNNGGNQQQSGGNDLERIRSEHRKNQLDMMELRMKGALGID